MARGTLLLAAIAILLALLLPHWGRSQIITFPPSAGGGVADGGTAEEPIIIDSDDTEALLVRKDGDAGDVLAVDTVNSQVLLSAGTGAVPVVASQAHPNAGLFFRSNLPSLSVAGASMVEFTSAQVRVGSGIAVEWTPTSSPAQVADLVIKRGGAAATLEMGNDAAAPVDQTFKAHDGSGTDIAGADLTIAAGNGTGTGAGGALNLNTTSAGGGSGSTQNTSTTRFIVKATGASHMVPRSAAPASGALGDYYVDSDLNLPCFHNGTDWVQMDDFTTVCA